MIQRARGPFSGSSETACDMMLLVKCYRFGNICIAFSEVYRC